MYIFACAQLCVVASLADVILQRHCVDNIARGAAVVMLMQLGVACKRSQRLDCQITKLFR